MRRTLLASLPGMAARDEIIAFLDDLLDAPAFDDYGPNGLQVVGAEEVSTLVTGVSAHLELFDRAAAAGADMVLCHHGILWNKAPLVVDRQKRARLERLFTAAISVAASHLPLDAHPEVGNNALICAALGLARGEPFGEHRGQTVGFVGRSAEGIAFDDLRGRCAHAFGKEPFVWDTGPGTVHSVGIVSGAAASSFAAAIAQGL